MYKRILTLDLAQEHTCFLWGPRQCGKSTLLKSMFAGAMYYDLLLSDEFRRLTARPSLVREELKAKKIHGDSQKYPVIIDEVQKIPELLDEVHWLIENRGIRFILCSSSARKLKRSGGNLLGGRAVRYELLPLVSAEIPQFSIDDALNKGLIPRHYLSKAPSRLLSSYIGDYLKEEIVAEASLRNLPAFSRFLEALSLSNGEIVNYANIASECGVSAPTVKSYFQILEDTLIGRYVYAYTKRLKRRIITSPKFYFFDVGVVNLLARRGKILPGSELFGKAFEHFIYMELYAHSQYSDDPYPIRFWRTSSGMEVDFILGEGNIAIEIKSAEVARENHLIGLKAFMEEEKPARALLVTRDARNRITQEGIEIMPFREFLEELWNGKIH